MASLSEKSVVIAVRDWQWETRPFERRPPQSYVSLSGNAEKLLGDGAVAIGDRFFLLEIKATNADISAEWTSSDTRKPKNAFVEIRKQIANTQPSPHLEEELISVAVRSMAGHFFIYWNPNTRKKMPRASLVAQPYLLGLLSKGGLSSDIKPPLSATETIRLTTCATLLKGFSLGLSLSPSCQAASSDINYLPVPLFTLDTLLSTSARIIFEGSNKNGDQFTLWHPVGFDAKTMKDYVDGLRRGENPDINCLLISSSGLCIQCSNAGELGLLLSELESQESSLKSGQPKTAESIFSAITNIKAPHYTSQKHP